MWVGHALLVVVCTLTSVHVVSPGGPVSQGSCSTRLWGDRCQYVCHCGHLACHPNTGLCDPGHSCDWGWFGPSCQYLDSVHNSSFPKFLWDQDDNSCNPSSKTVLSSRLDVELSWIRLVTNDSESVLDIEIEIDEDEECHQMVSVLLNPHTLDIVCANRRTIHALTLRGAGVPHLCSLYVTYGRNVAIAQPTTQTGILPSDIEGRLLDSAAAVDGIVGHEISQINCSHTNTAKGVDANWTITFARWPVLVNRIVVFNRDEGGDTRWALKGFTIDLYDSAMSHVRSWRDDGDVVAAPDRLFLIKFAERLPIRTIVVHSSYMSNNHYALSFCEFQVWGELVCPEGRYGLDCEKSCSDKCKNRSCVIPSGLCVSCVAGRLGSDCQTECKPGYHGQGCVKPCPVTCADDRCNVTNGHCFKCVSGYEGLFCDEPATDTDGQSRVDTSLLLLPILLAIGVILVLLSKKKTRQDGRHAE